MPRTPHVHLAWTPGDFLLRRKCSFSIELQKLDQVRHVLDEELTKETFLDGCIW